MGLQLQGLFLNRKVKSLCLWYPNIVAQRNIRAAGLGPPTRCITHCAPQCPWASPGWECRNTSACRAFLPATSPKHPSNPCSPWVWPNCVLQLSPKCHIKARAEGRAQIKAALWFSVHVHPHLSEGSQHLLSLIKAFTQWASWPILTLGAIFWGQTEEEQANSFPTSSSGESGNPVNNEAMGLLQKLLRWNRSCTSYCKGAQGKGNQTVTVKVIRQPWDCLVSWLFLEKGYFPVCMSVQQLAGPYMWAHGAMHPSPGGVPCWQGALTLGWYSAMATCHHFLTFQDNSSKDMS